MPGAGSSRRPAATRSRLRPRLRAVLRQRPAGQRRGRRAERTAVGSPLSRRAENARGLLSGRSPPAACGAPSRAPRARSPRLPGAVLVPSTPPFAATTWGFGRAAEPSTKPIEASRKHKDGALGQRLGGRRRQVTASPFFGPVVSTAVEPASRCRPARSSWRPGRSGAEACVPERRRRPGLSRTSPVPPRGTGRRGGVPGATATRGAAAAETGSCGDAARLRSAQVRRRAGHPLRAILPGS